MRKSKFIRAGTVYLAVLGIILTTMVPSPAVGQPPQPISSIRDVALDHAGTLKGKVVDSRGQAISNIPVQISRGGQVVASIVTGDSGEFAVKQLAGGVYHVAMPNQQATYRIWSAAAAPPMASPAVTLTDADIIRGKCGANCGKENCLGNCGDSFSNRFGRGRLLAIGGGLRGFGSGKCARGCEGSAGWGFSSCGGCGFAGCDSCCNRYKVGKPWIIAAGIAVAIALPIALDDHDGS